MPNPDPILQAVAGTGHAITHSDEIVSLFVLLAALMAAHALHVEHRQQQQAEQWSQMR